MLENYAAIQFVLALLCCGASIGLLWRNWVSKSVNIRWLLLASLTLGAGFYLVVDLKGAEYGVIYYLIAFTLMSLTMVFIKSKRTPLRASVHQTRFVPFNYQFEINKIAKRTQTTLIALLCGVCAIFTSIGGTLLLQSDISNQFTLAILTFPVIWASYSIWSMVTNNLIRTILILIAISLAMSLSIFSEHLF